MGRTGLVFSLLILGSFSCDSEEPSGLDGGPSDGSANVGDSGTPGRDGGASCTTDCGFGRQCCSGECTNPQNDPRHCGQCGNVCTGATFCTGGTCTARPCSTNCNPGAICCGTECCTGDTLCCDPQGPIETGARCTPIDARGTCPVGCAPLCKCASPDTPIATSAGEVPLAALAPGDLVYSVHGGLVRLVPVLRVSKTSVRNHVVVALALANGSLLEVSEHHPTADGRRFGDLHAGDELDGIPILSAKVVPYRHAATHDLLPASDTGTYFAGGALIGSTLSASTIRVPTTGGLQAAVACTPEANIAHSP